MAWDYPSPFIVPHRVDEADIDALQHTNNGAYVRWCGDVAWAHSSALGMGIEAYHALDRAMAVREARYTYLQATQAGDALLIATWITGWDQKLTMSRAFQICRARSGETVLRATMDFVCIAISSGRPKRMPEAFIEAYGPHIVTAQ